MSASNRDDFSKSTKQAVALRAGYLCSFPGCRRLTAGPSDESPSAVAAIGIAAHICAAAPGPGARRHDPAMSAEERSSIENAIWLCSNHATLIDRDETTYTRKFLMDAKHEHEAWCAEEVRHGRGSFPGTDDLVSLGPNVICLGDIISIDGSGWTLSVRHFVIGDPGSLIAYRENFATCPPGERYVLLNSLGDGRELTSPPTLAKNSSGFAVTCSVAPRFPRIAAQALPTDFALYPKRDISLTPTGDIETVSGLEALPQKIWSCLSMQMGESPFNPGFGTRLARYCQAFRDSPWLGSLLKLEVIRQAAIPFNDTMLRTRYTPFLCVDRVWKVEALAGRPENDQLPLRLELDVNGVDGRWIEDISVVVPKPREVPAAASLIQRQMRSGTP